VKTENHSQFTTYDTLLLGFQGPYSWDFRSGLEISWDDSISPDKKLIESGKRNIKDWLEL